MSPFQLSVFWRLSLIFFFNSFLFFLDIFTIAVVKTNCHHGNVTHFARTLAGKRTEGNQAELLGDEPDWKSNGFEQSSLCRTQWLSYGQTAFMVGLLLGTLMGGPLSDRYGRRPVLLVCVCMHAVCGVVPAILPQPFLFLAIRCLTGVCCCCINICSFTLAVEWTGPSARLWPPAFLGFCFSLGTMVGPLLAWLSPTWTKLHLSLALPQLICLPLYYSIPESPSWLMLMKRISLLDHYRSKGVADKQCVDLLLGSDWLQQQKAAEASKDLPPGHGDLTCDLNLLKHPTVLLRLCIMSYLSAASALTYFGICMNIGSFGVSIYCAQFFSGLSETPCLLIPLVRLGRRPMSMLTLFLSGTSCLLSLMLSRYQCDATLVMSFALIGKFCILATIFILALYSIELFPTVVRQRCVSLVNLCFRLGCLVSTLLPSSPNGAISLAAMLLYSSGPILGCGLCLLLPETSGTPLPDSLEDCRKPPENPLGVVPPK
ncbi:solute carrier family 22 member 6 isoform X2 [Nerophis lumbriciformis]|uniref:solute carrier family 22 member 6 isoform X2 n=1 Tax=Nerophis lumbriciformis TaxID=546530 RepID=UPI002AE077C3|nr:solute carrier family 22 member 6-like isoform X2 [Nerophis lumbriciformis]